MVLRVVSPLFIIWVVNGEELRLILQALHRLVEVVSEMLVSG